VEIGQVIGGEGFTVRDLEPSRHPRADSFTLPSLQQAGAIEAIRGA
jgi:hypothetical protein